MRQARRPGRGSGGRRGSGNISKCRVCAPKEGYAQRSLGLDSPLPSHPAVPHFTQLSSTKTKALGRKGERLGQGHPAQAGTKPSQASLCWVGESDSLQNYSPVLWAPRETPQTSRGAEPASSSRDRARGAGPTIDPGLRTPGVGVESPCDLSEGVPAQPVPWTPPPPHLSVGRHPRGPAPQ